MRAPRSTSTRGRGARAAPDEDDAGEDAGEDVEDGAGEDGASEDGAGENGAGEDGAVEDDGRDDPAEDEDLEGARLSTRCPPECSFIPTISKYVHQCAHLFQVCTSVLI